MSTTRFVKSVFREIDRAQKQAVRERERREREFIREQKLLERERVKQEKEEQRERIRLSKEQIPSYKEAVKKEWDNGKTLNAPSIVTIRFKIKGKTKCCNGIIIVGSWDLG